MILLLVLFLGTQAYRPTIVWDEKKEELAKQRFKECSDINSNDMREVYAYHFSQARFLMGISKIPENPAKLGNKVDKFIKWWDKGTGGYMYSKKYDFAYARCFKCGSQAIVRSMMRHFSADGSGERNGNFEKWIPESEAKQKKIGCFVGFVRNPITRFASGYNEYSFRIESPKRAEYRNGGREYIEYLQYPPNSTARPAAFLRDILKGEFFEHKEYVKGFPHVVPMWSFLKKMPRSDVMLRSEILNESYVEFQKRCTADKRPIVAINPEVGQHGSSADVLGIYQAMKDQIKMDPVYTRALCHIFAVDFYCFAMEDEIPIECQGIDFSVKSGAYTLEDVQRTLAEFKAKQDELHRLKMQHNKEVEDAKAKASAGAATATLAANVTGA